MSYVARALVLAVLLAVAAAAVAVMTWWPSLPDVPTVREAAEAQAREELASRELSAEEVAAERERSRRRDAFWAPILLKDHMGHLFTDLMDQEAKRTGQQAPAR